MRRSQSMENLPMLPEEAKMATALLRLTLSDKQESSTESDFQSYISKHSHFPYHKAVPRSEPIPIGRPVTTKPSYSQRPTGKRVLRRRCESSPPFCTTADKESKTTDSAESQSRLSQSAPAATQSFFQRLLPSFLKRASSEKKTETSTPLTVVKPEVMRQRSSEVLNKNGSGLFVRQLIRNSDNNNNTMDNFIFMSMR